MHAHRDRPPHAAGPQPTRARHHRRGGGLRLRRRPRQGRHRGRAPVPDGARVADVARDPAAALRHRPHRARRRVPPAPAGHRPRRLDARPRSGRGAGRVDVQRGRRRPRPGPAHRHPRPPHRRRRPVRHPPHAGAHQLPAGEPGRGRRRGRPRRRGRGAARRPAHPARRLQHRRRPRAGAVARALPPDLRRPARHPRVPRAARAAAAGHDRRRLRAAGGGPRVARGPRRGRVPARPSCWPRCRRARRSASRSRTPR